MRIDRRRFLAGLAACPLCAAASTASAAHWAYEGEGGPGDWGNLEPTFKTCAVGSEQSPVDISGAVKAELAPLALDWRPQAFKVVNNGHTIQANAQAGSAATLGTERFALAQFHFHTPSEHALAGGRTEMEAHFVHASENGRLAVVGVLLKAGAPHPGFARLIAAAPKSEGEVILDTPLDPNAFLPTERMRYRYQGSLTTPPCSETVDWNVLAAPVEVGAADIAAFRAIFPMNARPLQPLGRRFVLMGG